MLHLYSLSHNLYHEPDYLEDNVLHWELSELAHLFVNEWSDRNGKDYWTTMN